MTGRWEGAGDLIKRQACAGNFRTRDQKTGGTNQSILRLFRWIRDRAQIRTLGMDYCVGDHRSAEYVFPMHMWQDYSHIPVYKKKIWNPGMAERVVEITHENQVFLIEEK